ncbi:MAG: TetR/AcrR family transcriptional regulator [Deltaproteobacteria bacterium]|jgi:AcrR family transcriptional regulator|nr:TetR/AcrR family transcriptional regulator [Deltaproteobacteria bacterium]
MTAKCSQRLVGRPNKADSDDTRQKILDEAILVFSLRGIASSTIKEISQQAGVTPASVYYHFVDKQTLVDETLECHLIPEVNTWWEVCGQPLDPVTMLNEMAKKIYTVTVKKPWFLPLWSRELAYEGGTLRQYLAKRVDDQLMYKFRENVIRGQKEGSINPGLLPEILYISIISNVCFPLLLKKDWEKFWNRPFEDKTLENHIWAMVHRGLDLPNGRKTHGNQRRARSRPQIGVWPVAPKTRRTRARQKRRTKGRI